MKWDKINIYYNLSWQACSVWILRDYKAVNYQKPFWLVFIASYVVYFRKINLHYPEVFGQLMAIHFGV